MLKLDKNPTFWNTVKIHLGENEPETFKVKYKVIPIGKLDGDAFMGTEATKMLLQDNIVDFSDVADETGKELKYSDELLSEILEMPHLRSAILKSYVDGVSKAAQGN